VKLNRPPPLLTNAARSSQQQRLPLQLYTASQPANHSSSPTSMNSSVVPACTACA
jgi:hypothetical protein